MRIFTRFLAHAALPLLLLTPSSVFAMKFSNSFSEFELPPGWTCQLDELTWTCQTSEDAKQGDAVVVLAAKKKGPSDTLGGIETFLWKPRKIKSEAGQDIFSKPNYVKTLEINGQMWADALHINSEIEGYYTRYIATIRSNILVAITFSTEKSKYEAYGPMFDALIKSVKVFSADDAAAPRPVALADKIAPGIAGMGKMNFGNDLAASKEAPVQKLTVTQAEEGSSLFLLLLLGGGGYFLYKRKKKQQQQQQGPPK